MPSGLRPAPCPGHSQRGPGLSPARARSPVPLRGSRAPLAAGPGIGQPREPSGRDLSGGPGPSRLSAGFTGRGGRRSGSPPPPPSLRPGVPAAPLPAGWDGRCRPPPGPHSPCPRRGPSPGPPPPRIASAPRRPPPPAAAAPGRGAGGGRRCPADTGTDSRRRSPCRSRCASEIAMRVPLRFAVRCRARRAGAQCGVAAAPSLSRRSSRCQIPAAVT